VTSAVLRRCQSAPTQAGLWTKGMKKGIGWKVISYQSPEVGTVSGAVQTDHRLGVSAWRAQASTGSLPRRVSRSAPGKHPPIGMLG
jgi:hypothetical protein